MKILPAITLALMLPQAGVAIAQRDPCIESKAPECKPIQQERCRNAADVYIAHIKGIPVTKPKEIEDSRAIIARMEKKIADNRRAGVDHCITWGEVNRIAAGQ